MGNGICFLGDFCQLEAISGETASTNKIMDCFGNKHLLAWLSSRVLTDSVDAQRWKWSCQICKTFFYLLINGKFSIHVSSMEKSMELMSTNRIHWQQNRLHFSMKKNTNINATAFRNYLKTYHTEILESNIPMTAIVIKAGRNGTKAKPPWHLANEKSFLKNVQKPMSNKVEAKCVLRCYVYSLDATWWLHETKTCFTEPQTEQCANFENLFWKRALRSEKFNCIIFG
jgi:hypothetical protein